MSASAVNVLIVDDNRADQELAIRALRQNGLGENLVVVEDGEQALDFVFSRGSYSDASPSPRPRLILLDLKLPKIDGLQVLQEIKSNQKTKMIPVVVLTSSREERDIIECYRLGANSYMVKPVDFDEFLRCVTELGSYWLECNEPPR